MQKKSASRSLRAYEFYFFSKYSASIPPFSRFENNTYYWDNYLAEPIIENKISLLIKLDSTTSIGKILDFSMSVFPSTGVDVIPKNNVIKVQNVVRGSYDPNDKLVLPNKDIIYEEYVKNKTLVYTIRFQNTGTFAAEFVRLVDSMSSDYDLSTFNYLGSSHRNEWQIKNGVLKVHFKDINLLDSTTNNLLSQGYFAFSIDLKDSLNLETEIKNRAYIYFDYNPPVITNYAVNRLVETVATYDAIHVENILVFPNPSEQEVYLLFESDYQNVDIYNQAGILVHKQDISKLYSAKIDITLLQAGVYFVKVSGNKTTGIGRFIKI